MGQHEQKEADRSKGSCPSVTHMTGVKSMRWGWINEMSMASYHCLLQLDDDLTRCRQRTSWVSGYFLSLFTLIFERIFKYVLVCLGRNKFSVWWSFHTFYRWIQRALNNSLHVSNYHSLASHTLWLPHCYEWDWWGLQTGQRLMGFLYHCSDSQERQFEVWTRLMERAALLLCAPG